MRPDATVTTSPPSTDGAPPLRLSRPDERRPRRPRSWFGVARSARARILASYVILLAVSALISTLAIRQILLIRLDDRVADAGQQEVLELDRLLTIGRDPETGLPFDSPRALFDAYLARNVPSNEEALLTFVDGSFHRSALARFPLDQLPAEQMIDWADLSTSSPEEAAESVTGEFDTAIGKAHYRVRRVVLEE